MQRIVWEVLIHDRLPPLFWISGKREDHGVSMWLRTLLTPQQMETKTR